MKFAFENLEVWQKSREIVKDFYFYTDSFTTREKFGLTNLLRRAAVSVSSNIAEGSTRWSKKEQSRFYKMAYGSLMEVLNQLILATDLNLLTENAFDSLRNKIEEISRMLIALYKSTIPPKTSKLIINSST